MTTKPKARKFRIKRTAPTGAGASEAAATARKPLPANEGATAPPTPKETAATAPGQDQARSGAVESAREVKAETDIDAIRREGLTGRQLRMARRMAQKHGLAPISDFDAVRQLRLQGIDPFQASNMLELVVPGKDASEEEMGTVLPGMGKIQLPQTVRPAADQLPQTEVYTADRRAQEITSIQRDIARRRRKRLVLLIARLSAFVFLPTILAGWYYYAIATPMFSTKSEFLIQSADGGAGGGPLSGLIPSQLANSQESIAVQSYLTSKDAMIRLDEELGYKRHFSQDAIDAIQRLDPDATNEAAHKVYKKNIKIGYDPTEGVVRMEVIAADPQVAADFSKALISYAEERVDELSQNIRNDAMEDARRNLETAKKERRAAQEDLIRLQEVYSVDPLEQLGALRGQITTYEQQLLEKQLALQALLDNPRPNQAKVDGARGDVRRLQDLLDGLDARMTEPDKSGLSLVQQSTEIELSRADLATADAFLQSALQGEKQSALEAGRQVRYLTVPVRPIASDAPSYPRKFENTILAFLIFSGIYLMVSLTSSILREQVSN
ncbi:capsule biosynthesis protein [Lentibacter sp. XHP0401]|jgi:capsular polysaccharide transport system permease protein|uniref:capsule biosynthesis protein n=1 Tax=Lentibacter sp. XHP0401 TaxID=2984334 RepID=UPI0021E736D4|nr:capsule biosynthesis protein [Lentibacter sp. XHP0401]MCV2894036.1 capsule biosynthesis protein [Lentibacter sp. XHP0401]